MDQENIDKLRFAALGRVFYEIEEKDKFKPFAFWGGRDPLEVQGQSFMYRLARHFMEQPRDDANEETKGNA